MAVTPKGVRQVNENVVQEGRGLVITDRDAVAWGQIPYGSLYINPDTGIIMAKLSGETDWVPAGIKNDGTLVISRDTAMVVEVFTVTNLNNGNGTFTYKNTEGEQRYKPKESDGYVFELDKGTYFPGRNHLTVIRNKTTEYSAASGDIVEMDSTRFKIKGTIAKNDKLVVRYIKWVKIGNPYPRFFESAAEPAGAELGDFWLDLDGTIEGLEDIDEDSQQMTVAWSNVTGKPTTLSGYGITDNVSMQGHTHTIAQVTGLENRLQNAENNITTLNDSVAAAEQNISTLQSDVTNVRSELNTAKTQIQNKITTVEGKVTSLTTRVTTAEGKVSALEGKATTAANNISTLQGNVSTLESDMSTAETKISTLETKATTAANKISNLETQMANAGAVSLVIY